MTDDRIAGTAKNLSGKVQEGFGAMTNDPAQEVRGKLKQAEGAAQDLYGQAKDVMADAAERAASGARDAGDMVRDFVEQRPLTTAIAALCLGLLIGRMGRPHA